VAEVQKAGFANLKICIFSLTINKIILKILISDQSGGPGDLPLSFRPISAILG
jgi:hypothetical protein